MKLYKYALAVVLAAGAISLVSCDDDFDRPPVIVPEATIEVNTAIQEIKEAYWSEISSNTYTTIPVNADGDSIVIGGTIISSDESGNIYKGLYLRDESGAMYLRVNAYDIYESYQPGQEVRINITGLLIGGYGRAPQIGSLYNNAVGQIEEAAFGLRAQCNGLPIKGNMQPVETNIADLNSYKNNTEELQKWMFQLVKLNNVSFEGGGSQLWTDKPGDTGSSSRTIKDEAGNTIIAYTSNKATFAGDVLPKGTGSVTAILSYYNGTWQLLVMDPATDCEGFEFLSAPEGSGSTSDAIFFESFATSLGDFTVNNVDKPSTLSNIWSYSSNYKCALATAYSNSTNYASESWLISPVIDLTEQSEAYLSFDHAIRYFTSVTVAKEQATVFARVEGTDDWTQLTIPHYGSNADYNYVNTGSIDLSAYAGKKMQIALRYISSSTKAGTWQVKNLVISPEGTIEEPEQPEQPSDDYIFYNSMTSSLDSYTIDNVSLSEPLNYIWTVDSQYGAKASAYVGGSNHQAESWLISPSISLEGHTGVTMSFEHRCNFLNGNPFADFCTVWVGEAGSDRSTWTNITANIAIPSGSSWDPVNSGEISLADFEGKSIQIGFRYTSTNAVGPTWEIKDLTVK